MPARKGCAVLLCGRMIPPLPSGEMYEITWLYCVCFAAQNTIPTALRAEPLSKGAFSARQGCVSPPSPRRGKASF